MSDNLVPAQEPNIERSESEASLWAWSSVRELLTFVMNSSDSQTNLDSTLSRSSMLDTLVQLQDTNIELSQQDLDTVAGGFFGRINRGIGLVARPAASL